MNNIKNKDARSKMEQGILNLLKVITYQSIKAETEARLQMLRDFVDIVANEDLDEVDVESLASIVQGERHIKSN